jgi:polo-like kinase 4
MSSTFGDKIEDYDVLDLLGKGGFACVYRARSKTNGQEVAIKMIDKKLMQAGSMVARVRNEVEIQSRLKHPTILELFNYFEDNHYVYLVLEICQNGELNRFLRSSGRRLTEEEARRVFSQVVQGLLYLHSHNILHRDLSLSNLLLTSTMDAKISDFGLATQLKGPGDKHYTMCGTPNYIAPEVASRQAHGLECDVWSLGCMLYTLLVGQPPFDTDGVRGTLNRVVTGDFHMPRHLSVEAQDLISSLLKKNPSQRLTLSQISNHPFMSQPRPPITAPVSLGSLDSGHATMTSTSSPHTPHSSPLTAGTRGPLRATIRPRGLPASHPPSTLTTSSHPPSALSTHRRSRSVDSIRPEATPTNYSQQPHTPSSRHSPLHSSTENMANTRAYNSSTRANHWNQGRISGGSNKENRSMSGGGGRNGGENSAPLKPRGSTGGGVPFKDRTNTSQNMGQQGERKTGSKGNSLSELTPPLNAARLRPIRQSTRTATVSITEERKVVLHFTGRRPHGSQTPSSTVSGEILQISQNGMDVEILKPLHSSRSLHKPSEEHEGFCLHASHTYHDLPPRYWKKYQYAAHFVSLVRSKTPKITLYSERAKCMMMENAPSPDFEACFYSGAKIHVGGSKVRCIEDSGNSYTLEEGVSQVPDTIAPFYQHMLLCQEKCRSVEQAISDLEKQSPGDSFFPVTIGRYGEGNPSSNDVYPHPLNTGDLRSQLMFASHTPPLSPRPSSLPSPPPLLPSSTPVHQDSPTSVKPLPPSSMYRCPTRARLFTPPTSL